ncbi:MAG: hypothetical protein IK000_09695 [Bacteroidaceae bacterium]|nr:hypothetical protein [Bacteroidaceae bacterium]
MKKRLRQIFPSSPGRMKKEKNFLKKEKGFFLKEKEGPTNRCLQLLIC